MDTVEVDQDLKVAAVRIVVIRVARVVTNHLATNQTSIRGEQEQEAQVQHSNIIAIIANQAIIIVRCLIIIIAKVIYFVPNLLRF